jgi:hypothetical protein
MERPNFYILLELDGSISDPVTIEAAVKKKQVEWSRDQIHATKGLEYQKYLEMLPTIRKIMGDAATRGEEAAKSHPLRAERRNKDLRKLTRRVAVLTPGQVRQEHVDYLVREYKGKLSEQEVRGQIPGPIIDRRPKVGSETAGPLPGIQEIAELLRQLEKRDLYDFLEVPESSTAPMLRDSAKRKSEANLKNNNKTAEVTATAKLCGHCLTIFSDPKKRESYNDFLDLQALGELDCGLELIGAAGEIRVCDFDRLVQVGMEAGLTLEKARAYIVEYARRKRWAVTKPEVLRWENWQHCVCHALNPSEAIYCRACHRLLQIACPKCGAKNPNRNAACTSCGLTLADHDEYQHLLRRADLAAAAGKTLEALDLVNQARVLWPGSPEAENREAKLKSEYEQDANEFRRIEAAVDERRFVAAEKLLAAFARRRPEDRRTAGLKTRIRSGIDRARERVEQGRRQEQAGRFEEATETYIKALHDCGDFPEALHSLARFPPESATALEAVSIAQGIQLRWRAPDRTKASAYQLLRKTGSPPQTIKDGTLITEIPALSFLDSQAVPGEFYYYAVYALREGIPSRTAAVVGPVYYAADVSELHARSGEQSITMRWCPPLGARRIEVWRQTGRLPSRAGDGVKVDDVTDDSAIDRDLKTDATYGYRVIAFYRSPEGRLVPTEGLTCLVHVSTPPKPVLDLTVERRGKDLLIRWTPPPRGQVQLFAFDGARPPAAGKIIAPSELSTLGDPLAVQNAGSTQVPAPSHKVFHLIPATLDGSSAVVGKALFVSDLEEVDGLHAEIDDGILSVRWNWRSGLESVVVAVRPDHPPAGPEDPGAVSTRITLGEYERLGCWRSQAPTAIRRVYVTAYAATKHRGNWIYTAGASPGARTELRPGGRCRVRFDLSSASSNWLGRKPEDFGLTIAPETGVEELPELLVVAKPEHRPLHREDGTVIAKVPAGTRCSRLQPYCLSLRAPGPGRFRVWLFPADDLDFEWLEITPNEPKGYWLK